MELTSASLHWRGLLLTASLLTYWNSAATAQVTLDTDQPRVAKGKNVLLRVYNLPEKLHVFYWFRGSFGNENEIARFIQDTSTNKLGPAYSGRETIYRNGSLLIREVTQTDTGTYILYILKEDYEFISASVMFQVHATTAQVTVDADPCNSPEGKNILLHVHNLPENIHGFYWYKGSCANENEIARFILGTSTNKPGPAYSGRETIYHNGSLLIREVTQKDTGIYVLNTVTEDNYFDSASVMFHVQAEQQH